ncbi:MAG: flagellar filament capping protein FliD [Woeseiaceae bacterium]|nr:flagellar filament capping protein FliD [Woeseiaceae bacterium]
MVGIVSSGIGSGLDIAGIVQGLVAAEGQPVELRIAQKEARAQSKLSAFGSLKSALSDLRDKLSAMKTLDGFIARTAASSNEDIFSAKATGTAYPATYDIEVVQLALAQRLTSGAFTGSDAAVGTGTLTVGNGTEQMNVVIDSENNTLAGIRDAINSASNNPGVSATIVNADSGSYLILTSDRTGAANTITVTQSGGDGGLAALEYDPGQGLNSLTESVAAQDAQIRIDGFDVVSSTNSFSGAIDGVDIDVFAESGGVTDPLTVSNDETAARNLVRDFVDSYNALITNFDSLTAFDAETNLGGPLLGDATVRGVRDQIRRELSVAVTDADALFGNLSDIGIETQLDGSLKVNDEQLTEVLEQDFARFGEIFSASDGFAVRLFDLTDNFLKSDGILDARTQGLETEIEGLNEDRVSLNERLASLETRLLRQFNALDSLLAQLNSTSNFLTQQLANLPGADRPSQS